jgi:hypothetical protein
MGGFVHQEPPEVNSAGNALAVLALNARTDLRVHLDPSDEAARAHAGWASSASLATCTQGWSNHLAALINKTAHAADGLTLAANQYQEADFLAAKALSEFQWQVGH